MHHNLNLNLSPLFTTNRAERQDYESIVVMLEQTLQSQAKVDRDDRYSET